MSLFGSSYKTYYNTSSMPLYDDTIAGVVKQSVVSATQHNANIGSTLRDNILNSMVTRAEGLYRYGSKGNYPWGLPDTKAETITVSIVEQVQLIIENELSIKIDITYCSLDVIIDPSIGTPSTPNLPEALGDWFDRTGAPKQGQVKYYVVEYLTYNNKGILGTTYNKWWFKLSDANESNYPQLMPPPANTESPYYPIIPLRVNGTRYDIKESEYYTQIRRACNFLGIDAEDIGESLEDQSKENTVNGDENPIEDAYVFIGVPVGTENQNSLKYLYEHFSWGYTTSTSIESDYAYWEANQAIRQSPPMNSFYMEDSNFRLDYGWKYITKELVEGNLTDNGKHIRINTVIRSYELKGSTKFLGQYVSDDILTLKKKISSTQYEVLNIHGLVFTSTCVGKELRATLEDVFEEETIYQRFVIPLRRDILKSMGKIKTHDVFYEGIRLMVNDKYRRKKEWYESGWFKAVVIVVAVVASIVTWSPKTGFVILTAAQIGIRLGIMLVSMLLKKVVIKALEDIVGEQWAALVYAVAMLMVGNYAATGAVAPSITQSISLGMQTVSTFNAGRYIDAMGEIQKELEFYKDEIASISEELDGLSDLSGLVLEGVQSDTNSIMEASQYVQYTKDEIMEPALVIKSTSLFTDAKRYTGIKYSPINSARILA